MSRTFDNEITLIKSIRDYDDLGNPIDTEERTTILCDVESITRHEFYQASSQGLKPSRIFIIHPFEYNGATTVEYKEKRYTVMRTYEKNDQELELTCEQVIGNG